MPDRIKYRAFTALYDESVSKLVTSVGILPILTIDKKLPTIPVEAKALWDTGAAKTCIKPALFECLKLRQINLSNQTILSGIGGKVTAKISMINLFLTPTLKVEYRFVYVADFPSDADVLIGMDIIKMGDFAVCNAGNKTSFSFVMPPFSDKIDFADKADIANKNNV